MRTNLALHKSFVAFCSYTWKIYAEKLINLASVYGFWKYISNREIHQSQRYMEMFYILKYRNLVSVHTHNAKNCSFLLVEGQSM